MWTGERRFSDLILLADLVLVLHDRNEIARAGVVSLYFEDSRPSGAYGVPGAGWASTGSRSWQRNRFGALRFSR